MTFDYCLKKKNFSKVIYHKAINGHKPPAKCQRKA